MQQHTNPFEETKEIKKEMNNKVQCLENQNVHLRKVIHHLQMEHRAILNNAQSI